MAWVSCIPLRHSGTSSSLSETTLCPRFVCSLLSSGNWVVYSFVGSPTFFPWLGWLILFESAFSVVVFATGVTLGLFTFLGIAFARPFVRLLFAISLFVLSKDFGEVGFFLSCYFERSFIIFQFVNRSDIITQEKKLKNWYIQEYTTGTTFEPK